MITELHIENFKGIRLCHVEKLGMINLLIGKNDSCKSTILEAAYTTLKETAEPSLNRVISRRSNLPVGGRELWYSYDTRRRILSSIKLESGIISMSATYDTRTNQITNRLVVSTIVKGKLSTSGEATSVYYGIDFSFRGMSGKDLLAVFSKQEREKVDSYIKHSKLIDSSSRNDLRLIEDLLGKVKFQVRDKEFGKFLFEIFGSGLKWEFIPHPDFPNQFRVTLHEGRKRVFLNGLGDGIRFGMLIIANSILSNDTSLFIEEIENNQHPESLKKLIPFLIDISKKNRLQVFITTHNPMVWSCFEKGFESATEKQKVLRVYHVKRDNKTGLVDCILQTPKDVDQFFSNIHKDLYGS